MKTDKKERKEEELFDFQPYRAALRAERKALEQHPPVSRQQLKQLMAATPPAPAAKQRRLVRWRWTAAAILLLAAGAGLYTLYYSTGIRTARPAAVAMNEADASQAAAPAAQPAMPTAPQPSATARRRRAAAALAINSIVSPATTATPTATATPASAPAPAATPAAARQEEPIVVRCRQLIAYVDDSASATIADSRTAVLPPRIIETKGLITYQSVKVPEAIVSSWGIFDTQLRLFFSRGALLASNKE